MILRTFEAKCDVCGDSHDANYPYSSDLKDDLRRQGWRVQNKITCPDCLRKTLTPPQYIIHLLKSASKKMSE